MELIRISCREYKHYFPNPFSLFNSVEFSELNRYKCADIHYLIFRDTKVRLGIILGETEDLLKVPFSASYGGFSFNNDVDLRHYDEACVLLKKYSESAGKKIFITLAPPLYDSMDSSKSFGAFMRAGAVVKYIDCNHYFELSLFENYESILDGKTRNKLRNALSSGLVFEHLDSGSGSDVERAYNVIKINRLGKGYPLKMSLENILDTIKIIPADFFVVSSNGGADVAAAVIFHTSKDTYQVVYWGGVSCYYYLKPMNFMSYKLFEYYYKAGVRRLDIGTSSEYGIPNYGLCEFKENIGCSVTARFSLLL